MVRKILLLAPSEAAKNTVASEFSGSSTVFGVAATALDTYNDAGTWYVQVGCLDVNEASLVAARTAGFVLQMALDDAEELETDKQLVILSKMGGP